MNRRVLLVASLLVVSVWALARAQSAPSLQGVWRVSGIVVTGANAASNPGPQPGLYLFTARHYSIMTVNGTTPRKDFGTAAAATLTDAEKMARYDAWAAFTANSGTYTVQGNQLMTRPLVAKNPGVMEGNGQTREFSISGNILTLIQRSAAGQPSSETRTTLTRVE